MMTQFYVSVSCQPTRAMLMSGTDHHLAGVGSQGRVVPGNMAYQNRLTENVASIAERMSALNYHTSMVGKWHLGCKPPYLPLQNGFQEYLGLPYSNDMWPVDYDGTPIEQGKAQKSTPGNPHRPYYVPLFLIDGNEKVTPIKDLADQDTLTTRYTERAVKFIERASADAE